MKIAIVFLMFFVFVTGCNKDKKNRGIIEHELNETACFPTTYSDAGNTISSQLEYDDYFLNNGCDLSQQTSIDFSRHTLLGIKATGDCKVKFYRQVKKDEINQCYTYTVWVEEKGLCKKLGVSMNWVLVPRLPENWMVNFAVKSW